MSSLTVLEPPITVQVEGAACSLRQELMRIALDLAAVHVRMRQGRSRLTKQQADEFEKARQSLEVALNILTAIDEATTDLEMQAPTLLPLMSEGGMACFRKRDTSVGLFVNGVYSKSHFTLRIQELQVDSPSVPIVSANENRPKPQATLKLPRRNISKFSGPAPFKPPSLPSRPAIRMMRFRSPDHKPH